jgi:peptide/nickel transport system substrate-binding protein
MMPESAERLAALIIGDVHIIQNVPTTAVSTLANNPAIAIKTTVGTRPKLLDINVTRPPFDDVRVRQALQHAINVEAILQQVVNGYGIPLPGPLSPANHYANLSLQPYGFNLERARSLLAEAGYAPEDIVLTIDTTPANDSLASAVATQLRAFGIQVSIADWDIATLKPHLLNCEHQAFLGDWGDSIFDPVGYIEAKWQTRDETSSAGRGNYACYSNAQVDTLIEAGASEANTQKRQDIYNEVQQLIYTESPSLFLYLPQEIEAASTLVHNWQPSPDGRINLHDVWLDQ